MRTGSRLPISISQEFTPRLDNVSLSGLSASCVNGLVTISWNELASPHKDVNQSLKNSTSYNTFEFIKNYFVQIAIRSGWVSGTTGFPYYPTGSQLAEIPSTNVSNISSPPDTFTSSANQYSKESGTAITLTGSGCDGFASAALSFGFVKTTNRTAEFNVSSYNSSNAMPAWKFLGPLVSGNARIFIRPLIAGNVNQFFYDPSSAVPSFYYSGNWTYVDVSLSGTSINAPVGAAAVTGYSINGRTISWSNNSSNAAYFIYVYKWNGSAWVELRNGYLADGFEGTIGTGNQSYTIPVSDGSGQFYISISTYSAYSNSYSSYANSSSYTL